ncbi:MAG: hypothetical protein JXR69_06285 [Candidatus Delongbacteria bacterium]|nr:hypothetical protein [Candidatus Delongbacteria bacterium]
MMKVLSFKLLIVILFIFSTSLWSDHKSDLEEALKYYPLNTGDVRKGRVNNFV